MHEYASAQMYTDVIAHSKNPASSSTFTSSHAQHPSVVMDAEGRLNLMREKKDKNVWTETIPSISPSLCTHDCHPKIWHLLFTARRDEERSPDEKKKKYNITAA